MTIYAKEGEIITCESGHRVAQFIVTVELAQAMDLTRQIKYFPDQPKPTIGQNLATVRCHCGAKYHSDTISGKFHFGDGWR